VLTRHEVGDGEDAESPAHGPHLGLLDQIVHAPHRPRHLSARRGGARPRRWRQRAPASGGIAQGLPALGFRCRHRRRRRRARRRFIFFILVSFLFWGRDRVERPGQRACLRRARGWRVGPVVSGSATVSARDPRDIQSDAGTGWFNG
jgi:hypothetical protein